ncbi:MAG: helix-turn-helix domain-containing protein [Vicinamibacterales bacterium]
MATERHAGDFGARLREAREKRGLTLRVMADTTKISVRALEALEKNDISRLPGGIFSRAFVRAYANEIGLDPEQTVAEFITRFPDEIVTQGHPRTRDLVAELENDDRGASWFTPLRVALVIIPLLAIAAYFLATARRAGAEPLPPLAKPAIGRQAAPTAGPLEVTLHATRSTTFSVASDHLAPAYASLSAGESRLFQADRQLHIFAMDPSALEWSVDGLPPRTLTRSMTISAELLLSTAGSR